MKKRMILVYALVLVLSLAFFAGCGEEKESENSATATTKPTFATASATSATATAATTPAATSAIPDATSTILPTEDATEEPTQNPEKKTIKINYVKDGLFALYEGTCNTLDGFDDTYYWDDISGNENHIYELENDGQRIYFDEEKGLFMDSKEIFFPEEITELINTNCYTVELKLDELTVIGGDFATLINNHCGSNKGNDKFALFIRNSNGVVEFKNSTNERPKADNGVDLVDGHTLTVTFDLKAGFCKIYSDGVVIAQSVPTEAMDVDMNMFVGHGTETKAFSAFIQSIRFYDRALTDAEVLQNATVANGVTLE